MDSASWDRKAAPPKIAMLTEGILLAKMGLLCSHTASFESSDSTGP